MFTLKLHEEKRNIAEGRAPLSGFFNFQYRILDHDQKHHDHDQKLWFCTCPAGARSKRSCVHILSVKMGLAA